MITRATIEQLVQKIFDAEYNPDGEDRFVAASYRTSIIGYVSAQLKEQFESMDGFIKIADYPHAQDADTYYGEIGAVSNMRIVLRDSIALDDIIVDSINRHSFNLREQE